MNEPTAAPRTLYRTRDFLGWEVVDRDGEKIGSVHDLLFDNTGRVALVDVQHGTLRKQHLLLPQRHLEWGEGRIILGGWTAAVARALPPYDPARPLDPSVSEELVRAYPWMYDTEGEEWRAPLAETRVVPLSEAKDFRLEKGAPDPRGWNVFGSDGERAGTITQLLVDPSALKVRYAEVDLFDDLFHLGDDRRVLVPLEFIELKERGNDAWVSGLTAAELAGLPAYVGGPVTVPMELAVQRAWDAKSDATAPGTLPPPA